MRRRLLNVCAKTLRLLILPVIVVAAVIFLKTTAVDYSHVSGHSMSPTLYDGQSLLVIKCAYGLRKPRNVYEIPLLGTLLYYLSTDSAVNSELKKSGSFEYLFSSLPKRGDIVALNIPGNNHFQAVKRCVAIAGDTIPYPAHTMPYEVVPYKGMVINARSLDDRQRKYLMRNRDFRFDNADSIFVALDDFVYVTGDNLNASDDSRKWGAVPMNLIFGRVISF